MATATLTRPSLTIDFPRAELLRALGQLATINVGTRGNSLPILQCALLRAAGGKVALTYTDLDRIVDTRLTATFDGECSTAVPLKRLHEVVRLLPSGADVQLAVSPKKVVVTFGRSRFDIMSMDADEFPLIDVPKRKGALSVSGAALGRAIERVGSHVAVPETAGELAVLTGLLFELPADGPRYLLGATRHRMARVSLDVKKIGDGIAGSFVVPREAITGIGKLFGDASNVELYGTDTKLVLDSGDVRYTASLFNQQYPAYSAAAEKFPTNSHAVVETKPLADAVRRVSSFSDHGYVTLKFAADEVTLVAKSSAIGAGEDVVPCSFAHDDGTAEPFKIRFNARYLLDGLEAVSAARTRMEFASPNTTARMRDADNKANTALAMCSPLQMPGED